MIDVDDATARMPASDEAVRLYEDAFARHAGSCLFNRVASTRPTVGDTVVVAESLRVEGDLAARALAEKLEAEALTVVSLAHAAD